MATKKTTPTDTPQDPPVESVVMAGAAIAEVLDPETAPLPALLADSVAIVPPDTDLEVVIEQHAAMMIVSDEMFDLLVAKITTEIDTFEHFLETDTGRKKTASLAANVARTKTAIDRARKALTERMRITTGRVNDVWKDREERLNTLRDRARKPLDDWEVAEKKRMETVSEGLTALRTAGIVREGETSASVQTRLNVIVAHTLEPSIYGEDHEHAVELKASVVDSLTSAIARLKAAEEDRRQAEEDRKELAELRAAKAKRDQEDADAKAEADRKAEEKAAEERAAKAKAEQEQRDKEKADREREEAIENAKREERDKIEREQKERADKESKEKAEAERKARNKKHREAVTEAAIKALVVQIDPDVSSLTAGRIVEAIERGLIPAVTLTF